MRSRMVPIFTDEAYASSAWFRKLYHGIKHQAAQHRYRIEVFAGEVATKAEDLPKTVIVTGGNQAAVEFLIHQLVTAGHRIVLSSLDGQYFGLNLSSASMSRQQDVEMLVRYYLHCEKMQIALFGFWKYSPNDMFRYRTILPTLERYGCPLEPGAFYAWEKHLSECDSFWESAYKYNAVICPSDIIGVYFLALAKERGLRVPEDLFVNGFTNQLVGQYSRPTLTTVAADFHEIGASTFSTWHSLETASWGDATLRVTVPSRLIVRQSTGCMADKLDEETVPPSVLEESIYYQEPSILALTRIENLLGSIDELDANILHGILQGKSYETLGEELFSSSGTIQYRVKRVLSRIGFSRRGEMEDHIHKYLPNF